MGEDKPDTTHAPKFTRVVGRENPTLGVIPSSIFLGRNPLFPIIKLLFFMTIVGGTAVYDFIQYATYQVCIIFRSHAYEQVRHLGMKLAGRQAGVKWK